MVKNPCTEVGTGILKIIYTSIFFVPPTLGSKLAKWLRRREEELTKISEERIKIVETGGVKIETILMNKSIQK